MEKELLQQELLQLKKTVEKQKMYIRQLEGILQVPPVEHENQLESSEEIDDHPEEKFEEDEVVIRSTWESFEEMTNTYLKDPKLVIRFTSVDASEFEELHEEFKTSMEMTTRRSKP